MTGSRALTRGGYQGSHSASLALCFETGVWNGSEKEVECPPPPDDPLDPTDDSMIMDGFVSHHDPSGVALWTTTLAQPGYDYVSLAP